MSSMHTQNLMSSTIFLLAKLLKTSNWLSIVFLFFVHHASSLFFYDHHIQIKKIKKIELFLNREKNLN